MSIHDFLNKIKNKINIDKNDILYLIILIVVSIGSFSLGKLSTYNNPLINEEKIKIISNDEMADSVINNTNNINKNYVASKNGKMYYTIGCSGAKRIKPENQIFFNTKEEAEKSGYQFSVLCKN